MMPNWKFVPKSLKERSFRLTTLPRNNQKLRRYILPLSLSQDRYRLNTRSGLLRFVLYCIFMSTQPLPRDPKIPQGPWNMRDSSLLAQRSTFTAPLLHNILYHAALFASTPLPFPSTFPPSSIYFLWSRNIL